MKHVLSVLVVNRYGVLTRISGMFSRRGFNIESLAVGVTEDEKISRMTIVACGDDQTIEQMIKQLEKLVDVLSVKLLKPEETVSRQLVLFKVRATSKTRNEIANVSDIFRSKVIDLSPDSLTIEMTGTEAKIEAMHQMLKDYGILEVVRTGAIAIERGNNILKHREED